MGTTKVKQLQPNVKKSKKVSSKKSKQLIKKIDIKDSPFQVVTVDGRSFGVMGQYKVTEDSDSVREVKEKLEAITWNRIIQVVLLLDDIKNKVNKEEK
jgi:translation elongation factor P/translation initiation factor 5A